MKEKTKFVLWSGGVDSTYLIWRLLKEGHKVKAGYINLVGNGEQTKRELEAISKIRPFFEKWNFEYIGEPIDFSVKCGNNDWCLSYPPLFLMLPYIIPQDVDEVAIGYVMNDDAISFLDEIKAIYNSMQGLCRSELPKLIFPITQIKKHDIWYGIPEEIRCYVTWCENHHGEPNKDNCPSCKRMEDIINPPELARAVEAFTNEEEEHF